MLDIIALLAFPIFFGLGIAYTLGCDHLRGDRS